MSFKRATYVPVTHLVRKETIVKKGSPLVKIIPHFRSMLNKEDGGCLIKICLSTDVNECVEGHMIVIPTPFVITLWVPTIVHADQD